MYSVFLVNIMLFVDSAYDFGSNIKQDDREALDSAAKFVADLLLREPLNGKLALLIFWLI